MKRYSYWNKYKRHQRYIERKVIKRRTFNTTIKHPPKLSLDSSNLINTYNVDFSFSKVLKTLQAKNFAINNLFGYGKIILTVPTCFCFSKNPDGTILFLRKLYTHLINKDVKNIHFNHIDCEYMGVCASTVMDIIILECIKWRKKAHFDIEISGDVVNGRVSNNSEVDALVKMSGLLRHLNITHSSKSNNIERLPMLENGSSDQVAEQTIAYFNRSLSRHGLELTKLGKNYFGILVGEIVDNCGIHGGEDAIWFTLGHYSFDSERKLGKCKLTIIDFGNTIYESLKYNSSKSILKQINHYVKKNWMSARSVRSEETLYTLFSLQQRVSRIVSKDVVRGNGTVTFIETILNLFNTKDTEH